MRLLPVLPLALALALAAPAPAVVLDTPTGTDNTTSPGNGVPWGNVGLRTDFTGVYLGYGWVLTAFHVGPDDMVFGGVTYPWVSGSQVRIFNDDLTGADLQLFRVDPAPPLPPLAIRPTTPTPGTELIMVGQGLNRGPMVTWTPAMCAPVDGYQWGTGRTLRWGRNSIPLYPDPIPNPANTLAFFSDFEETGTDEAQAVHGDSGGAVFVENTTSGKWELAGILYNAFGLACGAEVQPSNYVLYGSLTYAADLASYRDKILDLILECRNGVDDDGDGDVDWPDDAGCTSENDARERPFGIVPAVPPAGIGALALLLAGAAGFHRSRRRARV
jgi:hypothetical protein